MEGSAAWGTAADQKQQGPDGWWEQCRGGALEQHMQHLWIDYNVVNPSKQGDVNMVCMINNASFHHWNEVKPYIRDYYSS